MHLVCMHSFWRAIPTSFYSLHISFLKFVNCMKRNQPYLFSRLLLHASHTFSMFPGFLWTTHVSDPFIHFQFAFAMGVAWCICRYDLALIWPHPCVTGVSCAMRRLSRVVTIQHSTVSSFIQVTSLLSKYFSTQSILEFLHVMVCWNLRYRKVCRSC